MDDGRDRGTWPDPVTAERLLRVIAARDCPADPGALQEVADARFFALLRVLTAASRGGEVDSEREQAALAAFRAARGAGGAKQGRRLLVSGRSAKVLAGGLAAVFAVSGVAVAAGTGVLPGPFRGGAFHAGPLSAGGTAGTADGPSTAAPQTTLSPEPDRDTPRSADPHPTDDGPGHDHHHGDGRAPHHTGVPRPSERTHKAAVRALCRSYTEAIRHGGHVEPWLVARLQREAGRKDRIAAYCRRLLAHAPDGTAEPTAVATPSPPSAPATQNGTTPTTPATSPSTSATTASTQGSDKSTDKGPDKGPDNGEGNGQDDPSTTHDGATTVK